MQHLNIDIETYSSVDIKTGGLYKYVQAPDFAVLLFGYSLDGAAPVVVDLAGGENIDAGIMELLYSPACLKHAYNAAFEWYCLSRHFQRARARILWDTTAWDEAEALRWLPQWRDTMLHGLYCGYTAGLAATCAAMGLPQEKSKLSTGSALIRTFCCPCKPTKTNGNRIRTLPQHEPEKWALFKEYNAQDVIAEKAVETQLAAFPVPEDVQRDWELDLTINSRGVAVDMALVAGAIYCSEQITEELTSEAVALSGLNNPNSVAQLSKWLSKEMGTKVTDLRKATVEDLLANEPASDAARRMLEIRQKLSKTSVKKYDAITQSVCADGRVRGLLQFYGANRTGRWAGRLVQVQNLPRTNLDLLPQARALVKETKADTLRLLFGTVPDTLSQLIRTAFVPAPGNIFVDADFSAIEARVISWLADEEWRLEVFRTHGKIYEASASQMFGVPLEKIVKGNPEYALRQKGKVAELALGYQGAAGALKTMGALNMGITEDELPDIVSRWRETNREIRSLWYAVENASLEVVKTGQPAHVKGLTFALEGDYATGQAFMTVALPSGRKLFYVKPFITVNDYGKDSLHYYGMDQTTKTWGVVDTYGGKLVENIVQAIARDCLAVAIQRLEYSGYPIVFHVHDEVVIEHSPVDDAGRALVDVCALISHPLPWAPDLPLAADGWVGEFYTKE